MRVQRDNEDEAWRAIVDNFGERAALDPAPDREQDDPPSGPTPEHVAPAPQASGWEEAFPDSDWSSERFVPPAPPPIPTTTPDRMVAWAGVFGSPTILLVCLVLDIQLPSILGYLLVAGFVGGFAYLVLQMPRGPRDPDDDGAVI